MNNWFSYIGLFCKAAALLGLGICLALLTQNKFDLAAAVAVFAATFLLVGVAIED